jgi:hypothetical protein
MGKGDTPRNVGPKFQANFPSIDWHGWDDTVVDTPLHRHTSTRRVYLYGKSSDHRPYQCEPVPCEIPTNAYRTFSKALQDDPGYAHTWYCNIAMPIFDEAAGKLTHAEACSIAVSLMWHLFQVKVDHP